MNVEVEVKGNAKTKIFSLFRDWIGDDMSLIKLIEYTKLACCPPKCVYGHLDLSVDRERRG